MSLTIGRAEVIQNGLIKIRPGSLPVPRFFSFTQDGEEVIISIYSNTGSWINDDGGSYIGDVPSLIIFEDPNEKVLDGTISYSKDGEIFVIDLDAEQTYSHNPTLAFSGIRYYNGHLYWIEFTNPPDPEANLYRSFCDLTGVTLIGTVEMSSAPDNTDSEVAGFSLNSTAAIIGFIFSGGETETTTTVRIELSGGLATEETDQIFRDGFSDSLGSSFGFNGSRILDSIVLSETQEWPTTQVWQVSEGFQRSICFTTNLGYVIQYGIEVDEFSIPVRAKVIGNNLYSDIEVEPNLNLTIEDHPTLGPPGAVFPMSVGDF